MSAPAERPPESSALTTLNARSREIFRNIVDSYLSSGEPVGSRHLSRLLPMSLSPASVRNVMQDLEELGLIYAPHASAGRMPTQQGLRLFVDALLEFGDLGREERARIDNQVRAAAEGGGFEGALAETTSLLSELTRGAGVVLTNKIDARLKHVEFVRLEAARALAILVSEDGSIENRVVATPPGMTTSTLVEASNFLNARIRGRTLAEVTAEIEAARREARQELDDIAARLVEAGLASWSGGGGSRDQLIVRGQANLLGDVHASEDLERIRTLFADLETKTDVIELLHRAETGEGVKIFIGSENKLFSLSGSSMIAAPLRGATTGSPACSASSGRPGSTTAASCRWSNMRRRCLASSNARARPRFFAAGEAQCRTRRTSGHPRTVSARPSSACAENGRRSPPSACFWSSSASRRCSFPSSRPSRR